MSKTDRVNGAQEHERNNKVKFEICQVAENLGLGAATRSNKERKTWMDGKKRRMD